MKFWSSQWNTENTMPGLYFDEESNRSVENTSDNEELRSAFFNHFSLSLNKKTCFFSIRVFFTDTHDSRDSREREGTIFYSTLPHPPAHEHYDIYLQLCMWDVYDVFLIATLVFTRLLLDEIYHVIEWPFEWLIDNGMFVCLLDDLILGFCYSDLRLETVRFELASTITLVLQANRAAEVLWYCDNESHEKETTEAVIRRYYILQNRCS